MSNLKVLNFVVQILHPLTSHADISPTDHLIRDLALDSLDVMDALEQVEDEYGLVIPTDILPKLRTVGDLVKEVEQRMAPKENTSAKLA